MYQLKIESAAGMKITTFIHPDIVNKIGLRLGSRTSFPRDQLQTVEIITSINDGWVTFNNGSRGCITAMIRQATKNEIKTNKRLMES